MLFVRLLRVCFVNSEGIVRPILRMISRLLRRMLLLMGQSFVSFFVNSFVNFLMNFMRRGSNVFFAHCGNSWRLVVLHGRRLASRIFRKRLTGKRFEPGSERTRIGVRFKASSGPKFARGRWRRKRSCRFLR